MHSRIRSAAPPSLYWARRRTTARITEEPMKRKLTLDLDSLTVKSFKTEEPAEARGTVQGHEIERPCPWSEPLSCQATVHTCASFDFSCEV